MKKKTAFTLLASSLFILTACGGNPQPSASGLSVSSEPSASGLSSSQGSASGLSSSQSSQQSTGTSASASSASSSATSQEPGLPPFVKEDHENSIIIHYFRDDGDYKNWSLWLWAKNKDGDQYKFKYGDDYGGVAVEDISTFFESTEKGAELGFIVRDGSWNKDVAEDRFVLLSELTPDEKGNYEFWLYTNVSRIYTTRPTTVAYLSTCGFEADGKLNLVAGAGKINGIELFKDGVSILAKTYEGVTSVQETLTEAPTVESAYTVKVTYDKNVVEEYPVSTRKLYETEEFSRAYNYDGNDLGVTYTSEISTFKVWSPVSKAIDLKIYDTGTPAALATDDHPGSDTPYKTVPMVKGEKGVWSVDVAEDLAGKYYTYSVTNYLYQDQEIVDPYAKAVGVNGLRGMILDLNTTDPEGWASVTPRQIDRKAMVVWECHIADLSSSETWGGTPANAKKYAGFHESGTTYSDGETTVRTGFDHVKELGVNAVQILPMFDQANDETNPEFNWGYNPLNYNAPEGVYSSDPYDGAVRIRELKSLIADYTNAGINIIMDVVYNHVNSVTGQNFDVLMPYYYFRYDEQGNLSNGSGCGNETASDHYMFSKFMIDSATYWAEEYKLGGFRFDLMGLHDLDTMEELTLAVKSINPGAVIYGEPWSGGTSPLPSTKAADQANTSKFEGYGSFSDSIRDNLISGGLNDKSTTGWATVAAGGKVGAKGLKLVSAMQGVHDGVTDPDKTVSYASCHDNYTLFDRAKAAHPTGIEDAELAKMAELANAVVLTSQGTAFILSGEEMLRTKGGDSNSYKSSYKVNELDYSRKITYNKLFQDYRLLVQMKINVDDLHLDKDHVGSNKWAPSISKDYTLIYYDVNALVAGVQYTFRIAHACGLYNPETSGSVDFAGYAPYLDTGDVAATLSAETTLQPYQTIIGYKTIEA